jgi:hypothetical protein
MGGIKGLDLAKKYIRCGKIVGKITVPHDLSIEKLT